MSWCLCARVHNEAITIGSVLVSVVWRAHKNWDNTALELCHDICQRIAEGSAGINGAFALEDYVVGLVVRSFLAEDLHFFTLRDQGLDNLAEQRILTLVVYLSAISKDHRPSPVYFNVGLPIRRFNILDCFIDKLTAHAGRHDESQTLQKVRNRSFHALPSQVKEETHANVCF